MHMTEEIRKALLDLKARQEAGEHMTCPRCGRDTMKPNLYTNALSRHADGIYICDQCGSSEAMLDFMNNPMPTEDWAIFNSRDHELDFKDTPGEEAWERIQKEQVQILAGLFCGWLAGKGDKDFKAYRREAMKRCPGLTFIFDSPFSAVYKVAEGDLILRFKSKDDGVKISRDILRFLK